MQSEQTIEVLLDYWWWNNKASSNAAEFQLFIILVIPSSFYNLSWQFCHKVGRGKPKVFFFSMGYTLNTLVKVFVISSAFIWLKMIIFWHSFHFIMAKWKRAQRHCLPKIPLLSLNVFKGYNQKDSCFQTQSIGNSSYSLLGKSKAWIVKIVPQ